ncbi:AbrB/MazE/SpoVT family DNA-binding domain-containing protein [Aliihoeflea aestuarii]|jgi:antitoxin PrlF|uniref:AbrB/MazE/SpoVT family DNA-binding domain-containing protein n=1 Tax=Aliihoeflea aestuarii TaxID=453840 RepID=UPI002092297C|nr:type II toxin-antitoxin system PrlF family antitoxin [Aliihoeflea aestuarii]MCO6391351.1 AbrB/MazE/SpoVT family DNA-binding domain-containing protein [Aliihoeflea aestuarii]
MLIESKITSKGQTTIPAEIRDYLKIGTGDTIQYLLVDGRIEILPRNRPVSSLFGKLEAFAIPGTSIADYRTAVADAFRDGGMGEEMTDRSE